MLPKFRAWDKFYECMITPAGIELENGEVSHIIEQLPGETTKSSITYYELMQSTGLKDKNGVEIFYGDIVKVSYKEHSYASYITYDFHETTIEGKYIHEDFHYYENPLYIIFEDDDNDHAIEVIGNIYEHPHLLEE